MWCQSGLTKINTVTIQSTYTVLACPRFIDLYSYLTVCDLLLVAASYWCCCIWAWEHRCCCCWILYQCYCDAVYFQSAIASCNSYFFSFFCLRSDTTIQLKILHRLFCPVWYCLTALFVNFWFLADFNKFLSNCVLLYCQFSCLDPRAFRIWFKLNKQALSWSFYC